MQAAVLLAVVVLFAFSMFHFAGDPVNRILGLDTPVSERTEIRRSPGLAYEVSTIKAEHIHDGLGSRNVLIETIPTPEQA